jgi:hypothetical protein
MPQKAEYKILQANNATQLGIDSATYAAQNWRPILMSSTAIPAGVVVTVILEHVAGS